MSLSIDDNLARLELHRASKRNAIDEQFLDELEAIVDTVAEDRRVQVLLMSAQGPAFCAGFDLDVLKNHTQESERKKHFTPIMRRRIRQMSRILERLCSMEPVSVAAVQGAAAGGGFSLALACDLRIVAEDACGWYPEVELGTPLSPASCRVLTRLVPAAIAKDIVLCCRRMDAHALATLGLANRVVGVEALAHDAREYARSLAAKPAAALLTSKATLDALSAGNAVVRTDMIAERKTV